MTEQEQRIAIAEACGWLEVKEIDFGGPIKPMGYRDKQALGLEVIPDYLNDLNAMHEAEAHINIGEMGTYLSAIANIVQPQSTYHPLDIQWWSVRATARQRAEAFLRTVGKWRGE